MNQKMPDSLTLQEQEKMLNADQKRVYDNIRNTFFMKRASVSVTTSPLQCLSVSVVSLAGLLASHPL